MNSFSCIELCFYSRLLKIFFDVSILIIVTLIDSTYIEHVYVVRVYTDVYTYANTYKIIRMRYCTKLFL